MHSSVATSCAADTSPVLSSRGRIIAAAQVAGALSIAGCLQHQGKTITAYIAFIFASSPFSAAFTMHQHRWIKDAAQPPTGGGAAPGTGQAHNLGRRWHQPLRIRLRDACYDAGSQRLMKAAAWESLHIIGDDDATPLHTAAYLPLQW